jgi:hypothetical protein
MKKIGLCLMLIFCLTLLNPFLPLLSARMSVFSPQDMLNMSDYIVVGEIKKDVTTKKKTANYTAIHKEVTILIKSVLKGDMAQKEVVLIRDFRTDIMNPGAVNYNFPKEGTKVMVLLKNYERSGISLTYENSICVIKKGKVQLYNGMGFGSGSKTNRVQYNPNDYENAYQAFYDKAVGLN